MRKVNKKNVIVIGEDEKKFWNGFEKFLKKYSKNKK